MVEISMKPIFRDSPHLSQTLTGLIDTSPDSTKLPAKPETPATAEAAMKKMVSVERTAPMTSRSSTKTTSASSTGRSTPPSTAGRETTLAMDEARSTDRSSDLPERPETSTTTR